MKTMRLTGISAGILIIFSLIFLKSYYPASAEIKTKEYIRVKPENSYLSLFFNPYKEKQTSLLVLGITTVEPIQFLITPLLVEKIIAVNPTGLDDLFKKYASEYGVSENLLKKIADCESRFNPKAVNRDYGGMFQFSSSTWQVTRQSMGLDPDPEKRFDGEEAIKTAAFKISRGGASAWPNCTR